MAQVTNTLTPELPQLNDIRAAENAGAAFQRGDPASVQLGFNARADAGTSERKCVDTLRSKATLSGDFAAGPFDGDDSVPSFRWYWREGHTKVWWAPRYLADHTSRELRDEGLVVRGARLDGSRDHMTYRYGTIVRSVGTGIGFFNSGVWVPSGGRWMLVATYGPNWGCFLVETQ